ncbi:hypothetical protein ANCDUO_05020 [Ancylostoma duodenale]|uniref:Uncharacterized protein n=1 Tax=Ancylostoma duodenale TaxID=51022 RepID=A0A0C2H5G0_9BILA|nr:hypothetical protein ANCDUO_05020 [Ancylostoma duodenale]
MNISSLTANPCEQSGISNSSNRYIIPLSSVSTTVDIAPALIMPSTRKTTSSRAATNSKTTRVNPISSTTSSIAAASPESAKKEVTLRLRSVLTDEAPEALPLLDQLLDLLRLDPREIVDSEKKARSIVIACVAEAEGELVPVDRQAHIEAMTSRVLSALGVDAPI